MIHQQKCHVQGDVRGKSFFVTRGQQQVAEVRATRLILSLLAISMCSVMPLLVHIVAGPWMLSKAICLGTPGLFGM